MTGEEFHCHEGSTDGRTDSRLPVWKGRGRGGLCAPQTAAHSQLICRLRLAGEEARRRVVSDAPASDQAAAAAVTDDDGGGATELTLIIKKFKR